MDLLSRCGNIGEEARCDSNTRPSPVNTRVWRLRWSFLISLVCFLRLCSKMRQRRGRQALHRVLFDRFAVTGLQASRTCGVVESWDTRNQLLRGGARFCCGEYRTVRGLAPHHRNMGNVQQLAVSASQHYHLVVILRLPCLDLNYSQRIQSG